MWCALLVVCCAVTHVLGHGRLTDPLPRPSLWRFGYSAPANYDDDGLNCGGFSYQWERNSGRCGICGDPFDSARPRAHELGGTYGQGYITGNYQAGEVIPITVYLTVSHLGYWELRICPEPYYQEQECFDQYLIELENGDTRYYPLEGSKMYDLKYRLPEGLSCDHCVLQWKYVAGNNWGTCDDGTGALGCGPQETFYSCADINITGAPSVYIPVLNANVAVANEDIPPPLLEHLANGYKGLLHLLLRDYKKPVRHRHKPPLKYSNKHRRRNDKKPKNNKKHKRKKISPKVNKRKSK